MARKRDFSKEKCDAIATTRARLREEGMSDRMRRFVENTDYVLDDGSLASEMPREWWRATAADWIDPDEYDDEADYEQAVQEAIAAESNAQSKTESSMGRKRYQLKRVVIEPAGERNASWRFQGQPISGTEHAFRVADQNFRQRNRWDFVVRVPKISAERVEVRPTRVPNDSALADLERRALTFNRASKANYRGWWYCQIALADPTRYRTKDVVHRGEKDNLPSWFGQLWSRIKVKDTVRRSRGTDGNSLIALVRPNDFRMMIRVYFALKVWILKEGIVLPE